MIDVLVLGGGTAGAAAAWACARRGLSVTLAERGPRHLAGATWVNGVPARVFDDVGLARPQGEELCGASAPFHLVAGRSRVTLHSHSVLEVDMRRLGDRLVETARAAGARVLDGVKVRMLDEERVEVGGERLHPAVIVDATGLAGLKLLSAAAVPRRDLCAAAQEVRELQSEDAARAFFGEHEAQLGETLSFAGRFGGFSVCNVRVHDGRVYLLTGSIPADGHKPGLQILEDFAREHAFVGRRISGGARAIPLERPLFTLGRGRIAAVGDAGRQVFAAHGSGIAAQLDAAEILADEVAAGRGPEGYSRRWWSRWGALFLAYDRFRRFTQDLPDGAIEELIGSGLLDRDLAVAGLEQRFPTLGFALMRRLGPAAVRHPGALWRLAPALRGMVEARVEAAWRTRGTPETAGGGAAGA